MRRPSVRPAPGLTLLEMLVTLVIVALVAAILGQALGQLARVERLLESGQLRSVVASLRAEWVRSALAGLLPGVNEAERLRGSERELDGLSSDVPQLPAPGLARLRLRLSTDAGADTTRLEMLAGGGVAGEPVQLLRWPGREGRFQYLDAEGRWGNRWPPLSTTGTSAAKPTLPRAVALDTGREGLGFLVAVPLASPNSLPTRADLESM